MHMWNEACEAQPGEARRRRQSAMLRDTVRWGYERIPFYRQHLTTHGVQPTDVQTIDDIHRLPLTEKAHLRDHYPFGLCAVPRQDLVRVHASSGTTGQPTLGLYTAADLAQWAECMARSLWAQGIRADDICQNAYGLGLFTGGLGFCLGVQQIGACLVPAGAGMTERQLRLMQDLGSTALFCTPTYALTIAERAEQLGVDLPTLPLRVGSFGAEPWTPEMRQVIEGRLGIVAHEVYGLTELMGPGVGFSCEAFQLHLNEDHIYPEIVDPATLEPVPLGKPGELVLTALQRRAMPLLRYRTHDMTRLHRVACACGRTLVVMDKILGRSDDLLIISGVNVFPSQVETVLLEFAELEPFYRLRVGQQGYRVTLRVEAEAKAELYTRSQETLTRLVHRVAARLHGAIGLHIPVELVAPGTIARSEGKATRVIDERSALSRPQMV